MIRPAFPCSYPIRTLRAVPLTPRQAAAFLRQGYAAYGARCACARVCDLTPIPPATPFEEAARQHLYFYQIVNDTR